MLEFLYCVSPSAKVYDQLHVLQLAVYATHKCTATDGCAFACASFNQVL